MRRVLPLLLLLTAPLSGCSFSYEFVVVNESDEAVEVRYTLKGPNGCADPPSKLALKQFEDEDEDGWRRLSGGEYSCDAEARAVAARLGPKEVLLVVRMHDSAVHSRDVDEFFGVENIRVAGARGSIDYGGRAARTQFAKLDGRHAFAITYR